MFRPRRMTGPAFRLPTPHNPLSGGHAPLMSEGIFPYCAMLQVAAEDTKRDYVICRGFDTRMVRFIDYAVGNADKPGIPVAKPFGSRMIGVYQIGQIFPAFLPLQTGNPSPTTVPWRVGQNPGVAATSEGHPADLSETVDEMSTAEGELINWMFIDDGGFRLVELCLAENHPGRGVKFNAYLGEWSPATDAWTHDCGTTLAAIDWRYGVPYPNAGARGLFTPRQSDTYGVIYECVSLDCDTPGVCCP